jgi:3-methyladenine DNA glycosylase Tag
MTEGTSFAEIEEAARMRHGSVALEARLTTPKPPEVLRGTPDDRLLSLMSLRIFRAGLKHELVDRKWPAFEDAFFGFDPQRCARMADEDIDERLKDQRLIRHGGKMIAIRTNAVAVLGIAKEHGSFGAWLAGWPAADIVGLWDEIAERFSQMGGNSGPMFLRMAGKDTFILTDSVLKALSHWQVLDGTAKGKAGRRTAQAAFSRWAEETGRSLCQLSQILAMSVD